MPQLDKLTFLTQFFWLSFFFLGFYFALLRIFLPQISQILKIRQRKMHGSQDGLSFIQEEKELIQQKNEDIFLRGVKESKQSFSEGFKNTSDWSTNTVNNINQQALGSLHGAYIQTIGKMSLSQNLILSQLEGLLPPTASTNQEASKLVQRENVFDLVLLKALQK